LIPASLFSQYYSGTEGLYGDDLKLVLHNKIKNHTRYPYTSSATDTWDILKESDRDPNNSDNVILVYTGYSVNAAQEYNNGAGWSREHTWAKSHGFPDESDTAYTDLHHLKPADISTNSTRSTLDFDNGGDEYLDGGSYHTGCYYDSDSWEPRDAVKGDVARMMLYMTVRYENVSTYDLELVETIPTSTGTPYFGKKSTLLTWNRIDPPDDFERDRNEVIYGYQNNRNPFIDHPEFADRIYNSTSLIVESTEAISLTEVIVTFSQGVETTSAENIANYTISNGIGNPTSAQAGYNSDDKKVLLTTSSLTAGSIYYVQVSNVASLTKETVVNNSIGAIDVDSSLPVELVSFTGNFEDGQTILRWTTATEIDNYGFEIQRAIDNGPASPNNGYAATSWETLGFVQGHGNSNSPKEYSFIDVNPFAGKMFYRLKQIDADGSFEYSETIEINGGGTIEKFELSQNYPNPFYKNGGASSTTIKYTIPFSYNGNVTLKVYDALGKEVATLTEKNNSPGVHTVVFNAANLSSGIYFFILNAEGHRLIKKGLLLK
jgi:endonuclease I